MARWNTPSRQHHLVAIFLKSGGFCVFGHKPCKGSWQEKSLWACAYGRQCPEPANGLCRFEPEEGKPHLPCKVVHFDIRHWHCAYGDFPCYKPFGSHYEVYLEYLIADWKADDKAQATAEWEAEREALHSLGERRYPLRGQFSNISKDIFYDQQPLFYVLGMGVSGLTYKPFAKVRLSSSYVYLYVDLAHTLKGVSKAKRRKAIRYGKPLPIEKQREVEQLCRLAVRHYLH